MDKKDIIERIRKLFAMGDSSRNPNEEEVKTALSMAAKLMKEHNLSLSDVELKEQKDDITMEKANDHGCFHRWERHLARMVAQLFDCDVVQTATSYYPRKFTWIFIGFPVDANMASQSYKYLWMNIRLLAGLMAENKWDFYGGLLARLEERIEEEIKNRTPEENSKCTAIVCLKQDIIEKWKDKKLPTVSVKVKNRGFNPVSPDYLKGYVTGGTLDLQNKEKLQ